MCSTPHPTGWWLHYCRSHIVVSESLWNDFFQILVPPSPKLHAKYYTKLHYVPNAVSQLSTHSKHVYSLKLWRRDENLKKIIPQTFWYYDRGCASPSCRWVPGSLSHLATSFRFHLDSPIQLEPLTCPKVRNTICCYARADQGESLCLKLPNIGALYVCPFYSVLFLDLQME